MDQTPPTQQFQSQNQLPNSQPVPKHFRTLLTVLVFALLTALYIIFALLFNLWPFERSAVAPTVETSATTPDPRLTDGQATVGWQTYWNEEMGFEIKLPAQFLIQDTNFGTIQIKEVDGKEFIQISSHQRDTKSGPATTLKKDIEFDAITNYVGINSGDIQNILLEKIIDSETTTAYLSQWSVQLNNGQGLLQTRADFEGKNQKPSAQDPNNQYKKVYSILLADHTRLEMFKNVIPTFRLIEPTSQLDTSGWKAYKQDIDLFKAKYPSAWSAEGISGDSVGSDYFYPTSDRASGRGILVYYGQPKNQKQIISEKNITLDCYPAIRQLIIDTDNKEKTRITIKQPIKNFTFHIDLQNAVDTDIFNAFLNNLHFTP